MLKRCYIRCIKAAKKCERSRIHRLRVRVRALIEAARELCLLSKKAHRRSRIGCNKEMSRKVDEIYNSLNRTLEQGEQKQVNHVPWEQFRREKPIASQMQARQGIHTFLDKQPYLRPWQHKRKSNHFGNTKVALIVKLDSFKSQCCNINDGRSYK